MSYSDVAEQRETGHEVAGSTTNPAGNQGVQSERARANIFSSGQHAFLLRSPGRSIQANGCRSQLPSGSSATLVQRVQQFFATNHHGPELLVGVLPFDPQAEDYLVQPEELTYARVNVTPQPPVAGQWRVERAPGVTEYQSMVSAALAQMAASLQQLPTSSAKQALSKVVLARSLLATASEPLDSYAVLSQLAKDEAVTAFIASLPPLNGLARQLVGGTPELLVSRHGHIVSSNPLAGSAKRHADPAVDKAAAEALLKSEKDRREHQVVVESILDNLAPFCRQLKAPAMMQLQSTASMWHLGTEIEGVLKNDDTSSAELAVALHPTPAVGGTPADEALQLIRKLEPVDRGFYAGAVGWTDRQGDGEWYLSLRCGEVCANQIRLFAGAGIVADSDPVAEAAETSAKFVALLSALGIDEQGNPLSK